MVAHPQHAYTARQACKTLLKVLLGDSLYVQPSHVAVWLLVQCIHVMKAGNLGKQALHHRVMHSV